MSAITTEEVTSGEHTTDYSSFSSNDNSPTEGHPVAPPHLTTAPAVKEFMKSYNRIRFNSIHASQPSTVIKHKTKKCRPKSCPNNVVSDMGVKSRHSSIEKHAANSTKQAKTIDKASAQNNVIICEACKAQITTQKNKKDAEKDGHMEATTPMPPQELTSKPVISSYARVLEDCPYLYPHRTVFVKLLKLGLPYSHITGFDKQTGKLSFAHSYEVFSRFYSLKTVNTLLCC